MASKYALSHTMLSPYYHSYIISETDKARKKNMCLSDYMEFLNRDSTRVEQKVCALEL